MKTNIITTLIIFLLGITAGKAQTSDPLELAKKIFSKNSLPDISRYSIGEYKGEPNGKDLQAGSTTKFMLLGQTATTAVVNMTLLDSTGNGFDTYLHFGKDSTWKMNTFRALAMTGILEKMKTELEKMTPRQVDETIARSAKDKNGQYAFFHSREEYDYLLGNTRLTLALDDTIAQHFLKNQAAFERLKDLALAQTENVKADEEGVRELIQDRKAEYRQLFISSVSVGNYQLGGGLSFLIGGMLDNRVGYLYVKNEKDLPEMSGHNVIMLRKIVKGWYIYKTT